LQRRRDSQGRGRQHHARPRRGVGALSTTDDAGRTGDPAGATGAMGLTMPVTATTRPPNQLPGLRAGVYGSGGAPWHHLALIAVNGGTPIVVRAEDISAGILSDLDVLIFPGGGALAMAGLLAPLGEE